MGQEFKDIDSKELFRRYKQDPSQEIRDELFTRYMYIADILSKKYINKGIDYEDIYQVASLGLLFAVQRFDVDKGYEFSSFATPTIVGEIKKYFRDKGWTIRVPRRIQELSKKVTMARDRLYRDLNRAPTVNDIANYLEVTDEDVIEAMEASKVYSPKSLDLEIESNSDDRDVKLMDIIGEEDKVFEAINNRDFIDYMMRKLNPMEKKIIKDRFFEEKTQIMVAQELEVSQMTISRLEKKILSKFREEYAKVLEV
ncbi:MAG: SigB/SigF/SigG family RNA polymerase sigma factor [Tissierellia bacterium]|mgnify:CR=1 FL=1|jgi:RNA polymerase sigma-B factor|nr:SigB/SigF/SigG family RNA polymerase sigma factor [Tissierellia bacterium]